jgi:hypothetical protein
LQWRNLSPSVSGRPAQRIAREIHRERLLDDRIDARIGHTGAQRGAILGNPKDSITFTPREALSSQALSVLDMPFWPMIKP